MVIGKGGAMLKDRQQRPDADWEEFLVPLVNLQCWVKGEVGLAG